MRERAFAFGSHRGLVGIVCEPEVGPRPDAPAVLLFNVGLNHRVGPGRLNVELARGLAAAGHASLRFDLSGLGDSVPRGGAQSDAERAVIDLREAMDLLGERTGADGFVVVGLCSGVDGAHAVALADPRVRGAVFIDGYAYATAGYRLVRGARKARNYLAPGFWPRWFRWKARRLRGLAADADVETGAPEPIFDRSYTPRKTFRADLESLLGRSVRMLFLYTADAWFFNHRAQFAPMVGWRALPAGLEVEHWTDVDHVFRALAARRRLAQRLGAWMEAAFPPRVPEAERRSAS